MWLGKFALAHLFQQTGNIMKAQFFHKMKLKEIEGHISMLIYNLF